MNYEEISRDELIKGLIEKQQELDDLKRYYEECYNIPAGYCILDEKGFFKDINITGAKILDKSPSSLINLPFSQFISEQDIDKFFNHLKKCTGSEERLPLEISVTRNNKASVYIKLMTVSAVDKDENKIYRITFTDITEKRKIEEAETFLLRCGYNSTEKEAEEALRKSEERLKDSQAMAHVGSFTRNFITDEVWLSDELYRMLGLKQTEKALTVHDIEKTIYPEDLDKWIKSRIKAIESGKMVSGENRIIRPDGEIRHHRTLLKVTMSQEGNPVEIFGTVQDITEQKEAVMALKRSHAEMMARTEALARIGSWKWNIEDDETTWSDETFCIFGMNKSEGVPPFAKQESLYHPDDLIKLRAAVNKSIATGIPYEQGIRIFRTDGEMRECIARGYAEINSKGKATGIYGSLQDITERKDIEEALKENRRFLADLIEYSGTLIYVKDNEGRYQMVNRRWEEVTGLSREKVTGKTDDMIFPPYTAGQFRLNDREVMESGKMTAKEELLEDDREERNFISIKFPLRNNKGKITGICGMTTEITELKKTQYVLQERVKELTCLYTISRIIETPDISFEEIINGIVKLIPCAMQFPELTEVSITLGEKTFRTDKFRKTEWIMSEKIIVNGKKAGEIAICYLEKRQTCDTYPFTSEELNLLRAIAERIGHTMERYLDKEIKQKLQERLMQAQKMECIGRLVGGMAHNFNNILAVILSSAELAMDDIGPEHPLTDYLKTILDSTERAAEITRQLLSFASKQLVTPKILLLNDTIYKMLGRLKQITGKNIDIIWQPGSTVYQVKIDLVQLERILTNLLTNSREAITGKGRVIIETGFIVFDEAYCREHTDFMQGDYAILSVSDNGCGITRETLANIFDPFFTTKEFYKGAGLGLSTVYGMVMQNNGIIKVYSEIDRGTSVKIYLPHYKEEITVTEGKPVKVMAEGNETLILVDDEKMLLNTALSLLKMKGYTVMATDSPAEAIRLASEYKEKIHMLITDVEMPEMNGIELAEILNSIHPHMKCLFMSGYTKDIVSQYGIMDEEINFLEKPFSMKNFIRKIREILDSNRIA